MRLGAHMSIAGGVHRAFARGESVGCTALQIFVKNANRWVGKPISAEDIAQFSAERKRSGIEAVIAHNSYLINLATQDEMLWRRSIDALQDELERCEALGLEALVIHPGAHMGSGLEVGIARVAQGLDATMARLPGARCRILLESTAGMGTTLGSRFEQLHAIHERVRQPERIGMCLDTAHVFVAGYDIRTAQGVRDTLDQFDAICGGENLRAIHLNDSRAPFASARDRHAHIGQGEIGLAAFAALLSDPRLQNVPMVLETPKGEDLREDLRNLETLRALAAGKTPAARPPLRTPEWKKGMLPSPKRTAARLTRNRNAKKRARASR
ncbi:MAG TPA: deoxyribonuclease IV [bacterium]|nr:deoxyribonuclease IV [bacterium]